MRYVQSCNNTSPDAVNLKELWRLHNNVIWRRLGLRHVISLQDVVCRLTCDLWVAMEYHTIFMLERRGAWQRSWVVVTQGRRQERRGKKHVYNPTNRGRRGREMGWETERNEMETSFHWKRPCSWESQLLVSAETLATTKTSVLMLLAKLHYG